MKTTRSIIAMLGICVMASMMVMFTACEDDKDTSTNGLDESGLFDSNFDAAFDQEAKKDQELSPSPESGAVEKVGEKLSFRVTGGNKPYTWSVSKAGSGTLDKSTTVNEIESVIYTVAAVANNTITVKDALGRAATIPITAGTKALSISPTTVSFTTNELNNAIVSAQFSASGGVAPYTWTDSLPGYGSIDGNGLWISSNKTAAAWAGKTITITLTDSDATTVSATIVAN